MHPGRLYAATVTLPRIGSLRSLPALDHPELLAEPVARALQDWSYGGELAVVEIDPALADTAAMSEAYGVPMSDGANCVVVAGRRDGEERTAACLVRADTRADVNNLVKRSLDVRKASFLPMERAVEETGMEYGGITPIGLPETWPVLVDSAVVDLPYVLVGSGRRRGKLLVPGKAFAELPGAVVLEGLGVA
jgi:prolyl-tRNA editing enzyme YbaK/EbsC (Cys-tRNA(Pro) deacylase)